MGLRIATNMAAMAARRSLNNSTTELNRSYQRLASGNRITFAGDDAAGLSISENLKAQVRSMKQAERNANDGISTVQVAEGGLTEISNILIRLRELTIQAASDTVGDAERGFINQEIKSQIGEIDRIANVTSFSGTQLLSGNTEKESLQFQVGIRKDPADRINFDVRENDVRAETLGLTDVNTETIDDALESLDAIDKGLSTVSGTRARLGAMQNKLQSTVNNLLIATENLSQARSRISDTDVAEETSNLVRGNILQSAGVSVLAQANNAPLNALKLI